MYVFVTKRVNYCNAMLYGTSAVVICRLQMVLNTAARLVVGLGKYDHITPVLCNVLHWLPVPQIIQFNIAALTFDCVRGTGPAYFTALPAQLLTILAVLVSTRPSVVICSFHEPEQLGSVGGASSLQLQLSGTHCHFTFARRPSVAVSFEHGSRLIFSGWPFTDFSSENY